MKTNVYVSDRLIWSGDLEFAPSVGSEVSLITQGYDSGYFPGSAITFKITSENPPVYDLTMYPPVLRLDANGYQVDEPAPVPLGYDND